MVSPVRCGLAEDGSALLAQAAWSGRCVVIAARNVNIIGKHQPSGTSPVTLTAAIVATNTPTPPATSFHQWALAGHTEVGAAEARHESIEPVAASADAPVRHGSANRKGRLPTGRIESPPS